MSFLSALKNLVQRGTTNPPPLQPTDTSASDKPIEFVDANGTRVFIAREEYRTRVLPGLFSDVSSSSDSLYLRIIQTLDDGFANECIEPARRLVEIDGMPERSHTVLGIVLLKNQRLEEAQVLYETFIQEHGERAIILTNLAKVYAEQGKNDLAVDVLWKSLLLDPNIANAVGWYAAIAIERGGRTEYLEALNRVATIPGSWHAQLWLARDKLEQGKKDLALAIYQEVLPRAKPDAEALMMISGDLGKNGHAKEALELVLPVFNIAAHGYKPALNLLQACVQLREVRTGNRLLTELKNLQRPDLLQYVKHFEHALKSA